MAVVTHESVPSGKPRVYVTEDEFECQVRFSGQLVGMKGAVIGRLYSKEDAELFADAKQKNYEKTGKI